MKPKTGGRTYLAKGLSIRPELYEESKARADALGMPWSQYVVQCIRNEKRIAFGVAGIGESENRLRKTCLSAHLAWQKNQPLTSYLAQHRHISTTEIYLGVMDEADGAAYFQIVP